MLGSYLRPPTSALEGDGPPRSLTKRPQRQTGQRLQRQRRGRERGEGQSGGPSWRREERRVMGLGERVTGQRGGGRGALGRQKEGACPPTSPP